MTHAERVERFENTADIRRGREMLDSGKMIEYGQLMVGDEILGVGRVDYVHCHRGGKFVHILAGGLNFRKRALDKVTIANNEGANR